MSGIAIVLAVTLGAMLLVGDLILAQQVPPMAPVSADSAEGVWHVEENSGARYQLRSIPKSQGRHRRLDGGRVMFGSDPALPIASETPEGFVVKVYEDRPRPDPRPRPVDPVAVAATYRIDIGSVDRIELRRFDRGLPDRGQWRNGFDVADMDGDGKLDLVFGPARKGAPHPNIFLGDGRGGWRPVPANSFPPAPYGYGDAVVADFNGDGRPDIALAMHLLGAIVLVSDGGGRFTPWSRGIELHTGGAAQPLTAFSSRRLVATDWNGDGRPDLVLIGEGPLAPAQAGKSSAVPPGRIAGARGLRVYLNQGDGGWTVAPLDLSRLPGRNFADALAIGDLDRDGRLDVLTGTRQIGNRWLVGYGESPSGLTFAGVASVRPRSLVLDVHLADLDRDGWLDAVLGYQSHEAGAWRSGIDVLWGGRDGWVRQGLLARESRSGISAVASGDLDGDGHRDVVALDQSAGVFLFLGNGRRGFVAERNSPDELPTPQDGCSGFAVRLRDLDGDGRDEILAAFAGEPAGIPGMPKLNQPGCPGGGSLRVWSPHPPAVSSPGKPDAATAMSPPSHPVATRR